MVNIDIGKKIGLCGFFFVFSILLVSFVCTNIVFADGSFADTFNANATAEDLSIYNSHYVHDATSPTGTTTYNNQVFFPDLQGAFEARYVKDDFNTSGNKNISLRFKATPHDDNRQGLITLGLDIQNPTDIYENSYIATITTGDFNSHPEQFGIQLQHCHADQCQIISSTTYTNNNYANVNTYTFSQLGNDLVVSANDSVILSVSRDDNLTSGYFMFGGATGYATQLSSTPVHTPLVVIPGIMGSEFTVKQGFDPNISDCLSGDKYAYNTGDLVWFDLSFSKILRYECGKYLNVLSLQSDGQTPTYPQVDLSGNPTHIPYDQTVSYLTSTDSGKPGYVLNKDLFVFPYDWRKDIRITELQLEASISAIVRQTGASKVNILAHSMGGLLARDYISDATRAAKVNTLVELGTPHAGTPQFLANLLYPSCLKAFDIVCVINGSEINTLVQNFTGAFELLPSKLYYQLYPEAKNYPFSDDRNMDNDNTTSGPLNYDLTRRLLANLGKNPIASVTADTFHDELDSTYDTTHGVHTYLIAGSGLPTVSQIHDYIGENVLQLLRTRAPKISQDADTTNGDGTVPLLSATLGQQNNVYYTNQAHMDLPTGEGLAMAMNLFDGITDANSIPNHAVKTIPFTYSGKIVGIYSPAQFDVYDNHNNHTGVKSDGSIEEAIPGSSYNEVGEAKFIYLPDGGNYIVKTKQTGTGSFDLKVKNYTNSQLTDETEFLTVPQSTNTTSSLDLSQTNPLLTVDENGDGTNVETIAPTERLRGSALLDYAPQFTSETSLVASASSSFVTIGTPFTVDIKIKSTNNAFNAAQATVTASSNLSVIGMHTETSDACNLQYTQTPTINNLSFAGALFGSSATGCTVYRLTVVPTSTGSGSITITNGSVKAYSDNTEILEVTQNAIFMITSASVTPTPTSSLHPLTITSPKETYRTVFNLTGTKDASITRVFVNGAETGVTYLTSTTWEVTETLSLGNNAFTVYGADASSNQTATQNVSIDRHTLGDINGDGVVDLTDASLFAVDFAKTSDLTYPLSDMNTDGAVDLTDLSMLAKVETQ